MKSRLRPSFPTEPSFSRPAATPLHMNEINAEPASMIPFALNHSQEAPPVPELAYQGCSPCKIKLQGAPLTTKDEPYDTERCRYRCEGKWSPTLHNFLRYLMEEKLEPALAATQRKNALSSLGTAVCLAVLYLPSTGHSPTPSLYGAMALIRDPSGRVKKDYLFGPGDVKHQNMRLHIQMVAQVPNSSRGQPSLIAPKIYLRRPNYNLRFDPRVTETLPSVASNGITIHLLRWIRSPGNSSFVSWTPTLPVIHARLYSRYGEKEPTQWQTYRWRGEPGSAKWDDHGSDYNWQYLPIHSGGRLYKDGAGTRDIDAGELSPRR